MTQVIIIFGNHDEIPKFDGPDAIMEPVYSLSEPGVAGTVLLQLLPSVLLGDLLQQVQRHGEHGSLRDDQHLDLTHVVGLFLHMGEVLLPAVVVQDPGDLVDGVCRVVRDGGGEPGLGLLRHEEDHNGREVQGVPRLNVGLQ